jgi:Cdc6-like AAA superfamily ATPase
LAVATVPNLKAANRPNSRHASTCSVAEKVQRFGGDPTLDAWLEHYRKGAKRYGQKTSEMVEVPGHDHRETAQSLNLGLPSLDKDAYEAAKQPPALDSVYIGKSIKPEFIYLRLANRHGLITGATGTGKTVTLQGLAEGFSDQGEPVFCADVLAVEPQVTLIRRGFASSALGRTRVITPSRISALILS